MMSGTVNSDPEAVLRLSLRDAGGAPHGAGAVIDTGFNGFLTLTPSLIEALGLPWLCRQQAELADGSIQTFDVYEARVEWDGQPRAVEVEAVDAQPLVGMALMRGYELRMQIVAGGSVTISALP